MNIQYKRGIRISGYSKEVVTLLLALCILKSGPIFEKRRIIKYPVMITIALGWLWGMNDPFYGDGIQTAGRGLILFTDGMNHISRFSLSYVILGILLKYVMNCNWIAHLYIMAIGGFAIYLMGKRQRHPLLCRLTIIMAFITPQPFVLSKWVYLDIPVIASIGITLLAFDRAMRKNSMYWAVLTMILLIITSLMKEIGFIVGIPILILLPYHIWKKRSLKLMIPIFMGILATMGILAYLCYFYRTRQPDNKSDVDWLLFNAKRGGHYLTFSWFIWALREHLITLLWWDWLIFALISLVRPKGKRGLLLISLILAAQALSLVVTSPFILDHFYPFTVPFARQISQWILIFIFFIFISGFLSRFFQFRRPKRFEAISWIMIVWIVFIFSAMGKCYFSKEHNGLWIVIDWRYVCPALPFLILLAAKGIGRCLASKNPVWFRFSAALIFSLCLMQLTLKSGMTASYYCEKARLNGEAYQSVRLRPEKVVYTHWPFYWRERQVLDLGELTWKTDGKNPRSLADLQDYLDGKKGAKFSEDAIALQSSDPVSFSTLFRIGELFPDVFFNKATNLYYITPFNSHIIKKPEIIRICAAKVQFENKRDVKSESEAKEMIRKFERWAIQPK
ncbi:phospholipid carrier-dependent glycosyltransferase [Candidatus Sumerlaeota bacterium]|nr:phospholipid carrier-dependent glycosyltransferase [Candidatus Sumerlaeota bacterium]